MIQIKDGRGLGYAAQVNKYFELMTQAKVLSAFARASEYGDAFAWPAVSADIDAGDTALLVCNNSQSRKLRITLVYFWVDVAAQLDIHLPDYPTLAGTEVVGVCLNRMLNRTADASAYADETGNTQGTIITTLHTNELATDQFAVTHDFEGALILGYHDCVAVDIVDEPGAFECTIYGYFEDN